MWCQITQHIDTQHNDTHHLIKISRLVVGTRIFSIQFIDTWHNGINTQHNDTSHIKNQKTGTGHNDIQHGNIQYIGPQHNDTDHSKAQYTESFYDRCHYADSVY